MSNSAKKVDEMERSGSVEPSMKHDESSVTAQLIF